MAVRSLYVVAFSLVAVAAVLGAYAWYLINLEQEPDPFSMTLLVSSSDANGTDENLTDIVLWVAVAQGEPKPSWSEVGITLESALGNETLSPPKLELWNCNMSPRAIIETSMGMITAELFADGAPGTVENFVNLANAGFYKNMIFHRIIKSFVIQTGDPTGTGRGGSDKQIKLETNTSLLHEAGALGMARGNEPNSASSSVPTGTGDRPVDPPKLLSVSIQ